MAIDGPTTGPTRIEIYEPTGCVVAGLGFFALIGLAFFAIFAYAVHESGLRASGTAWGFGVAGALLVLLAILGAATRHYVDVDPAARELRFVFARFGRVRTSVVSFDDCLRVGIRGEYPGPGGGSRRRMVRVVHRLVLETRGATHALNTGHEPSLRREGARLAELIGVPFAS